MRGAEVAPPATGAERRGYEINGGDASTQEMPVAVQLLREVSARKLAKITGRSPEYISKQLEQIPAAHRTRGGHWKCPLWAWQRWQAEGDRA